MPRDQLAPGPVIAVTGATGFIGRHIVRVLAEEGYEVRALTRRTPVSTDMEHAHAVSWVSGALTDDDALRSLLKGVVGVVHCAGAIKAANRDGFLAVNAAATRRLAEIAAARPNPPRFIHLSSLAAREPRLSPYAASKRAGEQALRAVSDLPSVVLRPPAVYGPGDLETLRIFQMAAKGFVLTPMVRDMRLSLVHVADVAGAVLAALRLDELPAGGPIEFDDGRIGGYSWPEIAATAGAALRTTPRIISVPAPVLYAAGAVASLGATLAGRTSVLNWGKVPELLHPDWVAGHSILPGYTPAWTLDNGFKDAVNWYASRGLLTSNG